MNYTFTFNNQYKPSNIPKYQIRKMENHPIKQSRTNHDNKNFYDSLKVLVDVCTHFPADGQVSYESYNITSFFGRQKGYSLKMTSEYGRNDI